MFSMLIELIRELITWLGGVISYNTTKNWKIEMEFCVFFWSQICFKSISSSSQKRWKKYLKRKDLSSSNISSQFPLLFKKLFISQYFCRPLLEIDLSVSKTISFSYFQLFHRWKFWEDFFHCKICLYLWILHCLKQNFFWWQNSSLIAFKLLQKLSVSNSVLKICQKINFFKNILWDGIFMSNSTLDFFKTKTTLFWNKINANPIFTFNPVARRGKCCRSHSCHTQELWGAIGTEGEQISTSISLFQRHHW